MVVWYSKSERNEAKWANLLYLYNSRTEFQIFYCILVNGFLTRRSALCQVYTCTPNAIDSVHDRVDVYTAVANIINRGIELELELQQAHV